MKFELVFEIKGVFYRGREEVYKNNKCKIYSIKKNKDSEVNCCVVIPSNDFPIVFERQGDEQFNKIFARAYKFATDKVNIYEG